MSITSLMEYSPVWVWSQQSRKRVRLPNLTPVSTVALNICTKLASTANVERSPWVGDGPQVQTPKAEECHGRLLRGRKASAPCSSCSCFSRLFARPGFELVRVVMFDEAIRYKGM